MIAPWPLALAGGIAGAALGSYATTAALRWARAEPSSFGRSHCDGCGLTLGYAQTVPVWSYVQARGACTRCGGRIDPLHPIGELIGATTGLAVAATLEGVAALLLGGLALLLLAASVTDLKVLRIPDALSLAVAGACGGLAWAGGGWPRLQMGLAAATVTLAVLSVLAWTSTRRKGRAGLGLGDVKLAAGLALWLGPATPWAIVAAAVLGLAGMAIMRPADGRLAFGPCLAVAGWLAGLGGEWGWWPTTL